MCFGALLCPLYIIDIFLIIYIERFWIPIPISYSNQLNCIAILSPGYFSSMCVSCFLLPKDHTALSFIAPCRSLDGDPSQMYRHDNLLIDFEPFLMFTPVLEECFSNMN